jgi:hypothetical protein
MLSRALEPRQQFSVMAQNEIKALADFPSACVPLQDQLGPLQQERGLGRVFLGGQLLQSTIEVLRDA